MFDAVRNQKRIVQIFLALITVPFALWGVDAYIKSADREGAIATVGGNEISPAEFQRVLREQQDRMRASLGGKVDQSMLDAPELKRGVLDSLVAQRVLLSHASKQKLFATDDQLRDVIATIPALQEDGKFSMTRYESLLKAQGMTRTSFEARLRQDLTIQQIVGAVGETAVPGTRVAARYADAQREMREVAELAFPPARYISGLKAADADVQKYYDEHKAEFRTPEMVRAEYVVLATDDLAGGVSVGNAEVEAYFNANKARYQQPEERRASHILLSAGKDAPEAERAAAREEAQKLLVEARRNPAKFAELARKHSKDPGSGAQGGDLGFFGRGAMVKPFEETVFAMKAGDLSDVVETDFGFHLIRLTEIRGGKDRTLEDLRPEIVSELKRQAAAKKFAEAADAFGNLVYEQADSLKPVVERFGIKAQTSGWIGKDGKGAAGALANPKLLAKLFSEDSISHRRNTEAIEIGPNQLAAARIVEHKPAADVPLGELRGSIEQTLVKQSAAAMARSAGEETLATLQKGEKTDAVFGPSKGISRGMAGTLGPAVTKGIFAADPDKLPGYFGASRPDGAYVVYRISRVVKPAAGDVEASKGQKDRYAAILAEEDMAAYLAALRKEYGVKVNLAELEKVGR